MEEQKPELKTKSKHKRLGKVVTVAIIILLLAVIGYLGWQLKVCMDQDAKNAAETKQLQSKVGDLTKQLAAAKKTSAAADASKAKPTACTTQVAITQSLKDNIADAIRSQNTAALEGYMASSVIVVLAASEKGGPVTPAQAVSDLDYLKSATSPWDFNLSAVKLNSFKAGFYKPYFEGLAYTGESANKYIVTFNFDTCGKISNIFMAVNSDLLT